MRYSVIPLLLICMATFGSYSQATKSKSAPQLGKNNLQEVIDAMTLEEKARLVVGMGMRLPDGSILDPTMVFSNKQDSAKEEKPASAPVVGITEEKVPGAAGTTFAIPRLGIPSIVLADGPAGLRIQSKRNGIAGKTFYCTAFPVATLLASTWDPALVKKVGNAMGNEVHEYGVDIFLAPALNIHRNPLGGRNFEYYSEDPVVSGKMAAAMVNGIQSNGVGTSVKHFAANNHEANRNTINVEIGQRALREIYLRGFEIAVKESDPWTVMSSYNRLNGIYTSESPQLLKSVLREDWKYKGFVMTDWFGGSDAVAQMKAGNDLLMPGVPRQTEEIIKAVNNGELDVALLNKNVENILNIILKTPTFKKYKFTDKPALKDNAQVARSVAAEGMVLIKNEGKALPFSKSTKKIAVFGNTSYDFISGGTGSGDVNEAYTVSLVDGLIKAGYILDENLNDRYVNYIKEEKAKQPAAKFFWELPPPITEMTINASEIEERAANSDVAIITIGRISGEFQDRKVEGDFNLKEDEKQLIKSVSKAFHSKGKKAIVILNIGGVIEIPSWSADADAILLAWQPGQEAGNAIVDILNGKVNPSGKLATTFPAKYEDTSTSKNFPGFPANDPKEVTYEEGIFVGYRYFDTYKVAPAYEFGYGLSYTNFNYRNLVVNVKDFYDKATITIDVVNSGSVPGKEVVQLYISAPGTKLNKPEKELKAFAKTALLQPGQKQTLTFEINAKDIASFDPATSSWVAEAGKYSIKMGSSSRNIKQTAEFSLKNDLIVEKVNEVLAPSKQITELTK